MQNLKSSNAKRRKLLYYLYYTPLVYFFPSIISRLRLKNILNNNFQEKYVQSRVEYYFKKTSNFNVSNKGKNSSELFWNQFFKNKQNSHFIDFYMLLQFLIRVTKSTLSIQQKLILIAMLLKNILHIQHLLNQDLLVLITKILFY